MCLASLSNQKEANKTGMECVGREEPLIYLFLLLQKLYGDLIGWGRSWQFVPIYGQIVNILGFVVYTVSATTTL